MYALGGSRPLKVLIESVRISPHTFPPYSLGAYGLGAYSPGAYSPGAYSLGAYSPGADSLEPPIWEPDNRSPALTQDRGSYRFEQEMYVELF